MHFVTLLSCDLETDIKMTTPQDIVISDDLYLDTFTLFLLSYQYHEPIKLKHAVINDDIEEDLISKITKSPTKTNPSKSKLPRFRNPVQIIKLSGCH